MKNLSQMLKQRSRCSRRCRDAGQHGGDEVEGAAGAGMVKVTLDRQGRPPRVAIDPI